jgi:hypothetical protein
VSGLRFDGWVPYRLYWQGSEPGVEWLYLGAKKLREPFFEHAIFSEAQTPFNTLFRFRTPMDLLREWYAASPGLVPSGFIFHLSRCGSTLITRMLDALPRNLLLSEPGVVDRILRAHERAPMASLEQRAGWVRWVVSALSQPRCGEDRLFIKFDPRNILDFPLLRLAFPDVPWVFVYRDPVEVLVSNLRSQSLFVTPGLLDPRLIDPDVSRVEAMSEEEYAARALGLVAAAAVDEMANGRGLAIEYRQLPGIVASGLAAHFGLSLDQHDLLQMNQVTRLDAKRPDRPFSSDSAAKQNEASKDVREFAGRWIAPHYARLEQLRSAQC